MVQETNPNTAVKQALRHIREACRFTIGDPVEVIEAYSILPEGAKGRVTSVIQEAHLVVVQFPVSEVQDYVKKRNLKASAIEVDVPMSHLDIL